VEGYELRGVLQGALATLRPVDRNEYVHT
jgi:hypothetical protein